METTRDSAKILREFGVIFDKKSNMSQFGGLATFLAFLEKGKFRKRFEAEFGYYQARTMMQFILGLVCGARSMVEMGNMGRDPLLKKYLKDPVEEAQLGRDVRSFSRDQIEALHDLVVSISILDFAQKLKHEDLLVFDVDATSVEKYGDQEGVEKGYVGADMPENCYQYLLIRLHNRNTFLYGTIRGGSAHSQNDFCGYLKRFLPLLKDRWSSTWRADAGYFNEEAFDLFSENDQSFFIKAPMLVSRLSLAQTSLDLNWLPSDPTLPEIEFASRKTMTSKGTHYREVFKRTWTNQDQLSLIKEYRYDCLATNDMVMKDDEAFKFYNGRANIENNIKELKNDYRLGKIITDSFDANDVITQLTLLTYLLVTHFKSECLPPKMSRYQLSTLRTHLVGVPGRLLSFARQEFTRIQNIFNDETVYALIFEKLRSLRSWVLEPPYLAV